jgi:hypothetical protein
LEGWQIGRLGTALSSLPIFQQQLPVLKIKIDYAPSNSPQRGEGLESPPMGNTFQISD